MTGNFLQHDPHHELLVFFSYITETYDSNIQRTFAFLISALLCSAMLLFPDSKRNDSRTKRHSELTEDEAQKLLITLDWNMGSKYLTEHCLIFRELKRLK